MESTSGGTDDLVVTPIPKSAPKKKQPTSTALKVFGWLWCVGMTITALALLARGHILPALPDALSAFFAAPPSWRWLARHRVYATRKLQVVAVVVPYVIGAVIGVTTDARPFGDAGAVHTADGPQPAAVASEDRPASEQAVAASRQVSKAKTLKAMTAKIADFALQPLDRKWNVEGYAKLGPTVWKTSNDLRLWAGLAALQNDTCKFVDAIAVWEQATRSQLSWHVVCGDERFVISEAQARSTKARLDPAATDAERKKYAAAGESIQPMSAAFANFNVAEAVTICDNVMKEASVDKGSFDASWSWDEARDEEAGQAIISREYSAKNAMGGTISGRYRCVINAADGSVVSLTATDAFGVHTVF